MTNSTVSDDTKRYLKFLETWIDIIKFKNRLNRDLRTSDWVRLNPFIEGTIHTVKNMFHKDTIYVNDNVTLYHGIPSVAEELNVHPLELHLALEAMCNTQDAIYNEEDKCYYVK